MFTQLFAVLASLAAAQAQQSYLNASADYESGKMGLAPTQKFHSTNSTPPLFDFNMRPSETREPGLLFMAPWGGNWEPAKAGPYIVDADGELVWDGTAEPWNFRQTMTFTPFMYQNQSVLALWQGKFNSGGYGDGYGLILDETYSVVANVTANVTGTNAAMDFHEFTLTDNGTALISVYNVEPYDLTPWGVPNGNNSDNILLGYAQEVDIATGEVLFSWRSLDHVDPHDCYASPQQTGTDAKTSWDYFHINAIEKDAKGNYLISARHCHTIYYVDGKSGDILWQIGGRNSSFELGPGVHFSWQHYARFRDNNSISLFDNGGAVWHGQFNDNSTSARGIHFSYDEEAKTTKLISQAIPFNHTTSRSQGSVDLMPNGNWLIGWGEQPYLSEFASTGPVLGNSTGTEINGTETSGLAAAGAQNLTMLWSAQFGAVAAGVDVQTYRLHRANWTGFPKTYPNLTAEANGTSTNLFMSWNGATEVATWEVFGANSTSGGEGAVSIANASRTGFETTVSVASDKQYPVYQVRALDNNGTTIAFSEFVSANGTDAGPPSPAQTSQASRPPQPSFTGKGILGANATTADSKTSNAAHTTAAAGVVAAAGLLVSMVL